MIGKKEARDGKKEHAEEGKASWGKKVWQYDNCRKNNKQTLIGWKEAAFESK